jgi:hypothetical protein
MLFGSPMSDRVDGVDPWIGALDDLLDDLLELLRAEHGSKSRAFLQAERELGEAYQYDVELERTVAVRRGIVLYALWRDPQLGEPFEESDGELLQQLDYVLPIAGPLFLANLGQRPDSFVALCATLVTLWPNYLLCLPRPEAPIEPPSVVATSAMEGEGEPA